MKVNAVAFHTSSKSDRQDLLSGDAQGQIRLWRKSADSPGRFLCKHTVEAHGAAVNCIASLSGTNYFVTGAADASVKVWEIVEQASSDELVEVQAINLEPKFFPLAAAGYQISGQGSFLLAVGGTKSFIQVFVSEGGIRPNFSLKATLTGHEGWIRSLDIVREKHDAETDLLIASASQDKYIRLWRVHCGADLPAIANANDMLGSSTSISLSSKAHSFMVADIPYLLTFEALLLGHEDWVYSVRWNILDGSLRLLSTSADSSIALWEPEVSSGVWVPTTRLGEISVQKGSTTATGSTGGFWTGLWMRGGEAVTSLGRTGSWRVWNLDKEQERWTQSLGVSGHTKEVRGICWSKDGSYLLSSSSDQTTRLHAPWRRGTKRSWHEFARPQIHGYDLNCVDSIGAAHFISGADEKLLRVFDQPRTTAKLLNDLSGNSKPLSQELPEVASIPVLGLSNKATEAGEEDGLLDGNSDGPAEEGAGSTDPIVPLLQPPLEDGLARHTLWPEREKLYGHGYEISAVAASYDGTLVASACKASSVDHAVIRLYETKTWHEVHPPLKAHSLTATCLQFSDDDTYLLSVGRDRQWAIFRRNGGNTHAYEHHAAELKGHSRMILGCAWAPTSSVRAFATAGRDKLVKLWGAEGRSFRCKATISAAAPVTAVDFHRAGGDGCLLLASGTETGDITLSWIDRGLAVIRSVNLQPELCPALAITHLKWQPEVSEGSSEGEIDHKSKRYLLAAASADCSTRIISIADPSSS